MKKNENIKDVKEQKLFSGKMYRLGLSRLAVLSIVMAVISIICSLIYPVHKWIDYAKKYESGINGAIKEGREYTVTEKHYPRTKEEVAADKEYNRYISDLWTHDPDEAQKLPVKVEYVIKHLTEDELCLPALIVPLFSPVLLFILFSFLHKRKSADFYFALPYSRACIYTSFTLAGLTVMLATEALSILTAAAVVAASPHLAVSFSTVFSLFAVSAVSSVALAGFALLALTLTGRLLSGILSFAMLSVTGRTFIVLLGNLLAQSIYVIPKSELIGDFYTFSWLLPFSSLLDSNFSAFGNTSLIVYWLAVGSTLIVAAGFLFVKYPSERAGDAFSYRLFRKMFTVVPLSAGLAAVMESALYVRKGFDSLDFKRMIFIFAYVVVLYIFVEFVMSKKLSEILHALPGFAVAIGACILLAITEIAVSAVILRPVSEKEFSEVERVKLAPVFNDKLASVEYYISSYYSIVLDTDEKLEKYREYLNDSMREDILSSADNCAFSTIFYKDGTSVNRTVKIPDEVWNMWTDEMYLERRSEVLESVIRDDVTSLSISYISYQVPGFESGRTIWMRFGTEHYSNIFNEYMNIFKEEYSLLSEEEKIEFANYIPSAEERQASKCFNVIPCYENGGTQGPSGALPYYVTSSSKGMQRTYEKLVKISELFEEAENRAKDGGAK